MIRTRRLRSSETLRRLTRETRVSADALVYPLFVREGSGIVEEISSLPGQLRYSPDTVVRGIEDALNMGVKSFLLFGLPREKDERGSGAYADDGVVHQALRNLKKTFGSDAYLITDVCLCEYTSHGHCGFVKDGGRVDNDSTLTLLAEIALSHVRAGSDMVAPSGMMDGTVETLRTAFDANGFTDIPIMSYAAKYASAFYEPFRDAADSAPQFGDRRTYQMDWHNSKEALRRIQSDIDEGADILIIKPALPCFDIIAKASERFDLPIAAYSVSGEYSILKSGVIDEYAAMCESAVAVFRAGADILITYFAKEIAAAVRKGDIG